MAGKAVVQTLRLEVLASRYYRRRPLAVAQLLYARWRLSQAQPDPAEPAGLLRALGVDPDQAFRGYDRWRDRLEAVAQQSEQVDGSIGISLTEALTLYGLVRALEPKYVIETGTATGVSTSFISAALIENGTGRLYSVDLPPDSPERLHEGGARGAARGPGWAIPMEIRTAMGNRLEIILEDVKTSLPALLKRVPYVDFFLHDDLHTPDHMQWEYELVWPHLATGGVLASDDINFGWIRFCRRLGMRRQSYLNLHRLGVLVKGAPLPGA